MLWKHPLFSGTDQTTNILVDYQARYDATADCISISGRLVTDEPAHSVVIFDDLGKPKDQYWIRGYTAHLAANGTFQLSIPKPPKTTGHYRILFCFNNGVVSGDGKHVRFVDRGDILKSYRYINPGFDFGG